MVMYQVDAHGGTARFMRMQCELKAILAASNRLWLHMAHREEGEVPSK